MRLNLAERRRIYSDTGPYKILTQEDLELLVDGDVDGSSIAVTSQTMAVICSFGARYRLENLIYYRTAATSENVAFFGKQGDEGFDWEELPSTLESDRITINFSEVVGHFEQIKVVHTVTTGTANVFEVELWADDTHVLFGPTGQSSVFSIDSGTNTLHPEKIQVYNPETVSADFYCAIDPLTTDYSGLSLGATTSGVFSDLYGTGISLPSDVPWSAGTLTNVVENSGKLVLVTGTYGYYHTPVIDISTLTGRRLFWQATLSGTSVIDNPSSIDSVPTVSVRFSDTSPSDPGWSSGQQSVDNNWSVVSGTLPFDFYGNNHILKPAYKNYFQAKVEFVTTVDGDTPVLEKLGIEQALKITIPPLSYESIYAKSNTSEHVPGRTSGIIVWSPEHRNIGQ